MTPPGTVNVADQAKIIDYLVNHGGNLFMESVNIGADHFNTDMLDEFGLKLMGDGENEEVENIIADEESYASQINFKYAGGDPPHYSVDRLVGTEAEALFTSEDGYHRIFLKNQEDMYKVISSSVILSALKNGDSLNHKEYLMAETINYFLGVSTITDIRETYGSFAMQDAAAYPNPFREQIHIRFSIPETSRVKLQIFDQKGSVVKTFAEKNFPAGTHQISWDGIRQNGAEASNGMYFFRLHAGNHISTGKLFLKR